MRWMAFVVVLLAGAAALWYSSVTDEDMPVEDVHAVAADTSSSEDLAVESSSPFSVSDSASVSGNPESLTTDPVDSQPAPIESPGQEIPSWKSALTDEQFRFLVEQLNSNPSLLQQLVDEFRQETDQTLKQQLARLLGEVGGEQVTLLASELIFSGDSSARTLGMKLLQDIQPGNVAARDIVSGMLATEVKPDVLVETLTTLANPGDVDEQSRAYLSDQVAWLTSHQDESVRSISLDILSRWSQDGRYTDTLVAGLDDQSAHVRASAAYSLVGHADSSPLVIEELFGTLRATSESKRVKRATIQALRSMPLSPSQLEELDALERQLNTVSR